MAARDCFVVEPPVPLPPGHVVHVPGRGELFVRDSGGDGPPVLLLHGWIFQSDLNWFRTYEPLIATGYRVLAVDHRGHGRGLRAEVPFRLAECAADAAALVGQLGCGPVTAVGYSMGGAVAQLMARDHARLVSGVVLCATSRDWQAWQLRAIFAAMGLVRLTLNLFPYGFWRRALRREGFPDTATTAWIAAELSRGSSRDIAEAGRELGRFDSRPWLRSVEPPVAVVINTRDRTLAVDKQYALAAGVEGPSFEFDGDHMAVVAQGQRYAETLVEAIGAISGGDALLSARRTAA
jgi:pimeloyl-ACP methyl ester carboxylesterase